MIFGSLPNRDRDDEGTGGTRAAWARHLAYTFGRAGLASLRCDRRGIGASAGSPDETTVDSLLVDGRAMLAALAAEEDVDRTRIGLVGRQELAGVATALWTRRGPRVLVLVEPHHQPLATWLPELIEVGMTREGAEQTRATAEADRVRRTLDAFRTGDPSPDDAPAFMAAMLRHQTGFYRSFLDFDPAAAAAKKKANVVELRTYPEVDPGMLVRRPEDDGLPATRWDPVATGPLEDIAAFVATHLGGR